MVKYDSRVAIFSDLHLGVHNDSLFWHNIALEWSDWFIVELKKRDIQTVFFLGDFFNARDEIAVNTLDIGYKILKKFQGLKLIAIPGNHDSFYKDHSEINSLNIFEGWSNVQLINDIASLDFGTSTATFVPWGGDLTKIQWSPYLFGHFEINTFKMNNSKVCEKGLEVEKFFKLSPHIYSGHFHVRDTRKYDTTEITYVGNTFETNFGEANSPKGFHVLDFDSGAVEFVCNTVSPKHVKIYLTEVVEAGGITPRRAIEIKGNIVRLVIDKSVAAEVVDAVQAKIKSYNPAQSTVEFLLNSSTIDVDEAVKSSDLSDVSLEKALTEFISFLEVPGKEKIAECCLGFYHKCK